jgi:galactofuranosylgalactofuranosylrhamnosyl-N-acetylglucosaminyl-diphospho-decaprenol beta-1,5/1,6-galactofuranosyltransferase
MTTTAPAPSDTAQRTLQRLLLPTDLTSDVLSLYVDLSGRTGSAYTAGSAMDGQITERLAGESVDARRRSATSTVAGAEQKLDVRDDALAIAPRETVSFATYLNAFPASYWRRWTKVRAVRLTLETRGTGTIIVYQSNARGVSQRLSAHRVDGTARTEVDLPLTAFGDGGWYWFDLAAGAEPLELLGGGWSADASAALRDGSLSIGMTTLNKTDYVVRNLDLLSRASDLREIVDRLYVVDQGTQKVRETPEYPALQAAFGEQLEVIEQANLGGSGGYSRGMLETLDAGRAEYFVTCDDDVSIEPETLVRLKTFADFATVPTLVGAHMFDLNNRSALHSMGESVDRYRFHWGPSAPDLEYGFDFSTSTLRQTPWLHRRTDVDYNGWWMCLIPVSVLREIGLSLPFFLKWDDSEYGLRAQRAGFPTVSLPGAPVWHISWTDKDDLVGWQGFFHERNRLITALLHSPYERGGQMVLQSQAIDVKHLISMQYYPARIRLMAQEDVLGGPDGLHDALATRLPEVRALTREHSDAQVKKEIDEFPAPRLRKPLNRGRRITAPHRAILPLWLAKNAVRQAVVPPTEGTEEHPQAVVSHAGAKWWALSRYDSALVSNAEGTGMSWYRRDPGLVRRLGLEAVRNHAELLRRWPDLARAYRSAMPEMVSPESWRATFARTTDA